MVDRYYSHRREISEISNTNNHPSFSSTLLDAIYRSIEQGEEEMVMYGETKRKNKQTSSRARMFQNEVEIANFQRACMIEKWMEKKVGEKVASRRKSTAAEEAESFKPEKEKPIVTKNQDGFLRTKSRALKIYADLKKVKHPISPGARLAGFLNSIFTAANAKKLPKTNTNSPTLKSASTCSSASSFSRSCLSKTPSSRVKSHAGPEKRSVRFSPVSVIVDEDRQPRGHKSLREEISSKLKQSNLEAINEEMMVHVMEKNRRVEEAALDFLRNYRKRMDCEFPFTKSHLKNEATDQEFDDDEDDDDAASYASSDLFELDNLSAIGMERYREELPVYETTHPRTNRAISTGLIL